MTAKALTTDELEAMPISVQDLYRPVLRERIPGVPQKKGDKAYIWWKEQLKRCKYGWVEPTTNRFLNGYHYFWMNFVQIPFQDKETNSAEWKAPLFRDNDEVILSQLWRNTARLLSNGKTVNARNHVEAKCRSIGWTQISLLGVALWTFIFKPDRQIGIGYSDDEVIGIEQQWFAESWARLPLMFRTHGGKELEVLYSNDKEFTIGFYEGKDRKIKKVHNSVQYSIISDKAGVFKGQRLNLIIAVEAGKWKGDSLKNFYTENQDCLEMGDYKWGMFLIGGTSNVIINKSTNYKDIYYNAESYKATRHFTPKTMCLTGFIDYVTGISNQTAAMAHIREERRKREDDPQAYQQYLIENPLTVEECFIPNEVSVYNKAKIEAQINYVKAHKLDKFWRRGTIEYERDDYNNIIVDDEGHPLVYFKEAQTPGDPGSWWINLQAQPNPYYDDLHIGAIDDTYKGSKEGQKVKPKDSKNCMIIWRQPTSFPIKNDLPCAYYLDKRPEMDEVYEEFYKGMLLYRVRQTLYEYNHDGFPNFLRDRKESSRLYYIDKDPGISFKERQKAEATLYGHLFFASGRLRNITLLPLLESLKSWGQPGNNDTASAFHILLILLYLTKEHTAQERVMKDSPEARHQGRVHLAQSNPPVDRPASTPDRRVRLGQHKYRQAA